MNFIEKKTQHYIMAIFFVRLLFHQIHFRASHLGDGLIVNVNSNEILP